VILGDEADAKLRELMSDPRFPHRAAAERAIRFRG
jgi:hypothetical protein